MCEASSLYQHREARHGDIATVGTVPGHAMRGMFEEGKEIVAAPHGAKLICGRAGATLFIEQMRFMLQSRLHNSEFANAENIECTFAEFGREFAVGDGFVMKNGLLIPLTEVIEGTRVRFGMAFA